MELAARDKLIEDNIRLVGYFAGKYAKKLAGKLDFDEVFSAANIGLVKAAGAFEPDRGKFINLVATCIWNRCLMDLRQKRNELQNVSLSTPICTDDDTLTLGDMLADDHSDFEDAVADSDRLSRFLACLSPRDQQLVLDYAGGAKQVELAHRLGISQSSVARRLKAIQRKEITVPTIQKPLDREEFLERASYDLERAKERSMNKVKKETQSLAERADRYNAARAEGMNPDEAAQQAGWKNFNSAQVCCCKAGIKIRAKAPTDAAPTHNPPVVIEEAYTFTDVTPPRKAEAIIQNIETVTPQLRAPESSTPEPLIITEIAHETAPVANENPVFAHEKALSANNSFPAPVLIPIRMEPVIEPDKLRTLRPCRWYGKDCTYTDLGDYIDIKPREGTAFQLTRESLKQFSEELQELLEIIK